MATSRQNQPAPLWSDIRQRLRGLRSQGINDQGMSRIDVIVTDDVVGMGSALFRDALPHKVALPKAEIEGCRNDQRLAAWLCGHLRGRYQPHIWLEPEHGGTGRADRIHLSRCQRPLRTVRVEIAEDQE